MQIRPATPEDAEGMSAVLAAIVALTGRERPHSVDTVLESYIAHPDRLACTVAVAEDGQVLGFQSVRHAREGNEYGVAPGWGIIGSHIHPQAHRRGVGSALFRASLAAAQAAGIPAMDAFIGRDNAMGLAYYAALGFKDYRATPDRICKVYHLT